MADCPIKLNCNKRFDFHLHQMQQIFGTNKMTHMFGRFIYIIDSKGITITAHTLSSGLDKLFGKKKKNEQGATEASLIFVRI